MPVSTRPSTTKPRPTSVTTGQAKKIVSIASGTTAATTHQARHASSAQALGDGSGSGRPATGAPTSLLIR
jgi:hypothetical protein